MTAANKAQARDFSFKVGFLSIEMLLYPIVFSPVGVTLLTILRPASCIPRFAAQNGSRTNRANDDGNIQGQPNNGCMGVDAAGLGDDAGGLFEEV